LKAKPTMFMLAGPNGAGKSTLYETRIKPIIDAPFINADVIQRDELKDPSMQAAYKAAEVAEGRRRAHLAGGKSFVSESTFSHASKLELIAEAKAAGFRVVMYHVNVRSADLSVARVAQRAAEGGHNVPEDKIRERYTRNQALIRQAVLGADHAFVYDNSTRNKAPDLGMTFRDGQVVKVTERVPAWARDLYADELAKFSPARLNPAAASFADAKGIAARLGGEGAQLRIPGHGRDSNIRGEIVGETAEHWLQRAEDGVFIAHFKTSITGTVQLHRVYDIAYPQRGRGLTHEVLRDLPARAVAFQVVAEGEMSRDAALKRYPELRPAFNELAVVKLKHPHDPEVVRGVRDALQARLNAGEVPAAPRPGQQLKIDVERQR